MRPRCLLIALGACGMASTAVAAPEVYTAEPGHTYASFSVSHMGMTFWRAKFNKTNGQVWLDREAGTGRVEITVDTSSVNFGMPIMDKVAQGDDFFNVAKYPTATYKSDSITFKDGVPVTVNGQLTLVGITKPVPLQIESFKCRMHPYAKREFCGAVARGQLNRVEFGMKRDAEHDPMVQLIIDIEAIQGDTVWKPPAGAPPGKPPHGEPHVGATQSGKP